MSAIKPIILYGSPDGLSPWKVVIIIEELNIPYKLELLAPADMAKPAYERICVNGRVPAIEDPNTGVTLWESGAVIEYLVETYDNEHLLTYTSSKRFEVKQWLYFQVTGQAPYHREAWVFAQSPEQGEKALKRYQDEVIRVVSVLNKALTGTEHLVGDKCTFADLAFVPWASMVPYIFGDEVASLQLEKKYPAYSAWYKATSERPSVQKMFEDSQAAMAAAPKTH